MLCSFVLAIWCHKVRRVCLVIKPTSGISRGRTLAAPNHQVSPFPIKKWQQKRSSKLNHYNSIYSSFSVRTAKLMSALNWLTQIKVSKTMWLLFLDRVNELRQEQVLSSMLQKASRSLDSKLSALRCTERQLLQKLRETGILRPERLYLCSINSARDCSVSYLSISIPNYICRTLGWTTNDMVTGTFWSYYFFVALQVTWWAHITTMLIQQHTSALMRDLSM